MKSKSFEIVASMPKSGIKQRISARRNRPLFTKFYKEFSRKFLFLQNEKRGNRNSGRIKDYLHS